MTYALLKELTYCLDSGFPAMVIETMLAVAGDNRKVQEAWMAWANWGDEDEDQFLNAVERMTGSRYAICADCDMVIRAECVEEVVVVEGGWPSHNETRRVCNDCRYDAYTLCDGCGRYYRDSCVTEVDGYRYCDDLCLDRYCTFCDQCDRYRLDDDEDHSHGCGDDCLPAYPHFEFPNDGHGTVRENERIEVTLPKGTIDDEGLRRIAKLVTAQVGVRKGNAVHDAIEAIGPLWQAKRGNFTRRLSSALYSTEGIKLPAGVIAEVGNIARAHSTETASWLVEFTRDLDDPPGAFYHDGSCWWGCYSKSRCALKSWGGLGLRAYNSQFCRRGNPSGRAWVQPLDVNLRPTADTVDAHAFLVFNGYGVLEGYTPARIVAHLTSRTYRKIDYSAEAQYVNGNTAYLIADEATCVGVEAIDLDYDEHHVFGITHHPERIAA